MRKAVYATTARTRVSIGGSSTPVRITDGINLILRKGVCRDCNTGWLAHLEGRVQPWLSGAMRGSYTALSTETQQAVAAWACIKALLIELVMRSERPAYYVPESNLAWLYEHRDD